MARRVISKKLLNTILLSRVKHFVLARKANLHPTLLSKIINGHIPLKESDPKVLRIGKVLGVPKEELFELEEDEQLELDESIKEKKLAAL